MALPSINVKNVTAGMRRIADALPDAPADAMAALTFVLVELAVEFNIPIESVHEGIDTASSTRPVAARKALS